MPELLEANNHINLNQHGTPVLAETNTNIVPIGIAHENGASVESLLDQYEISREQLDAALSYFYEHRDEIREYEAETERLLQQYGTNSLGKLLILRNRNLRAKIRERRRINRRKSKKYLPHRIRW
jgi:uncharacterized protein (DUF433 family)